MFHPFELYKVHCWRVFFDSQKSIYEEQPDSWQNLIDPGVQHAGAQFSFWTVCDRMKTLTKSTKKFGKHGKQLILLSCQKDARTKIDKNCNILVPAKFTRAKKIVDLIKASKEVVIEENENSIVNGTAIRMKVPNFLFSLWFAATN